MLFNEKSEQHNIMQKLEGYKVVHDIHSIPLNSHVRYYTWKNNAKKFCLGGFLKKKHKDYIKLSNGSHSWSVQINHYIPGTDRIVFKTIFYVKDRSNQYKTQLTVEKQDTILQDNFEYKNEIQNNSSRQKKYIDTFYKQIEQNNKKHNKIGYFKKRQKYIKQDLI